MSRTPAEFLDLLGLPYVRGARGPEAYDCYGLVKEMFRRDGTELPDFESPGTLESVESLVSSVTKKWRRVPIGTVGAIITFRVEGLGAHVGYCLGGDRFLHAWEANGVTTDRLTNGEFRPIASYFYV